MCDYIKQARLGLLEHDSYFSSLRIPQNLNKNKFGLHQQILF